MQSTPTVVINLDSDNSTLHMKGGDNRDQKHTVIQDPGTNYRPESVNADRKIVGFLVSYSKKETGQHWPIFLGRNVIGSSPDNDVPLRERSVSDIHATINTRRVTNLNQEEELIFIISDNNSTGGTRVDGRDIVYDNNSKLLKPNEYLDIGNYRLMLICIDTKALNLVVNPDFRSLDSDDENDSGTVDYDQRPNQTRIHNQK